MADTLTPATFVALKDADPEGDVLLLIGPPNELKSLLVSSKVLSLASPVFNKMLQIPRFLEGVERSSKVPLQLPLPEDNPEAVTWLCNAIHFSRSVDHDVSFSLFEELAILCDKYDIAPAITPWSRWWLQKWKGSPDGEDKYLKMLYISYAYGSYHAFRLSSRNIVLYSTAEDFETYQTLQNQNDTGLNILPETLLESLKDRRKFILSSVPKALESHLAFQFEEKGYNCQTLCLEPAKCNRAIKIGHHWQELYRLGLFPSRSFSTSSIDNVAHRMLEYRNWVPDGGADTCDCVDMKGILVRMSAVYYRKDGFCLNCVRKGKFTQKDGHCSLQVPRKEVERYLETGEFEDSARRWFLCAA